MRKVVIAVALALSLGACESNWMKAYGPNFPPPEQGEAALYIVRSPAPTDASLIPMTMNMQPVGALSASTWMRFDVLPDLYNIRVHGRQASTDLIVTVMPGESRFLTDALNAGGLQTDVRGPLEAPSRVRRERQAQVSAVAQAPLRPLPLGREDVILITGGGSGLGLSMAEGLGAVAAQVIITGRSAVRGSSLLGQGRAGIPPLGAAAPLDLAIRSVRKGGQVVLIGNLQPNTPFPLQEVVTRQITIKGSCSCAGEYPEAIRRIDPEPELEAVLLTALLLFIRVKWPKAPHGIITGLFFLFYAVIRIALEGVRQPDSGSEMIMGLTKGQFFSTFMIVTGAAFIAYGWFFGKRLPEAAKA